MGLVARVMDGQRLGAGSQFRPRSGGGAACQTNKYIYFGIKILQNF